MVSLFATLGVLLGLVVLIVPGVLLMALWSLSMPALAAERLGATAAMTRSWRLVRPRIGTVLLLRATWIALYIPLIVGVFFAGFVMDDPATSLFMILNVTLSVLMIAGAVLWATAFVAIRNDSLIGGDA